MGGKMSFYKDLEELKTYLLVALKDLGLDSIVKEATDNDLGQICVAHMALESLLNIMPQELQMDFLKKLLLTILAKAQVKYKIDLQELCDKR